MTSKLKRARDELVPSDAVTSKERCWLAATDDESATVSTPEAELISRPDPSLIEYVSTSAEPVLTARTSPKTVPTAEPAATT